MSKYWIGGDGKPFKINNKWYIVISTTNQYGYVDYMYEYMEEL